MPNLSTPTRWKDITGIAFIFWVIMTIIFAAGFICGNTLQPDMSVAGLLCQEAVAGDKK